VPLRLYWLIKLVLEGCVLSVICQFFVCVFAQYYAIAFVPFCSNHACRSIINCNLVLGSEVMSASLNFLDRDPNCCIVAVVGPMVERVC